MKLIASEESASSPGAEATSPTQSTKLGQLRLLHYANPVFEISTEESQDEYIIKLHKIKDFEVLNFVIMQNQRKNTNASEFIVFNIDQSSNDEQYTSLNELQVEEQSASTPSTVIHSEFEAELNEFAKQDCIEPDLVCPSPSNQINLDNFYLALSDSPLADLHMPGFSLEKGFRKLPDLDSATKQTFFKKNGKIG